MDQQFVEFVVKSLVSKPDAVVVERRIDEKGVLLELTVDPEDLGRVIGKRGATAQSIRTLLRALGTKNDARYNLKIVDNGPERPSASTREESASQTSGGLWGDESTGSSASKESVQAVEDLAASIDEESNEPDQPDDTKNKNEEEDSWSKTRKELADLDDLDV
ncbi:KH domain-containing protein [Candidatus Parcubacteria bacterium]|nr:KH domain-containing protein [Candidatus Parcubacteria bacterium]